jgi:hypothetical protein
VDAGTMFLNSKVERLFLIENHLFWHPKAEKQSNPTKSLFSQKKQDFLAPTCSKEENITFHPLKQTFCA